MEDRRIFFFLNKNKTVFGKEYVPLQFCWITHLWSVGADTKLVCCICVSAHHMSWVMVEGRGGRSSILGHWAPVSLHRFITGVNVFLCTLSLSVESFISLCHWKLHMKHRIKSVQHFFIKLTKIGLTLIFVSISVVVAKWQISSERTSILLQPTLWTETSFGWVSWDSGPG